MREERQVDEQPQGGEPPAFPEQTKPAPAWPTAPGRPARDDRVERGTVLDDRYRLDERVGAGGSATVYRATDTILRRQVAVKVFHPEPPHAARTERRSREMRLAAAASDPHLLAVYDAHLNGPGGTGDTGPCYLVTELIDGPTLADVIHPRGLPPFDVRRIGSGIAQALGALHERGLVHRDVKPSNVLLTVDHEAKLADLGIARELDGQPVTRDGAVPGTAPYLSPEQAEGKSVGPASDVYSLGLVLLECLTGRREFPGAALESALGRLLRDPEVPPTLPEPWPTLLARMTDRDPDRRPPARVVAAVLDASSSAVDGPVIDRLPADRSPTDPTLARVGSPDSEGLHLTRRPRRRAWLLPAVVAGVLGIGVAVAFTALDPDGARPAGPAPAAPTSPTAGSDPATVTVTAAPLPAATSRGSTADSTAGARADSTAGSSEPVAGVPVVAGTTPSPTAETPTAETPTAEAPAGLPGPGPAAGGGPAATGGPAGGAGPAGGGNEPGPADTGPGNGNGNGGGAGNGNGHGPGSADVPGNGTGR